MQKELQINSEKDYGFPRITGSSRLPKVAWKAGVSLCILIILWIADDPTDPPIFYRNLLQTAADVSRNMFSIMYATLLNSQNHTHSQNSMTGDVEYGLVKLAMLSLLKSTQFS